MSCSAMMATERDRDRSRQKPNGYQASGDGRFPRIGEPVRTPAPAGNMAIQRRLNTPSVQRKCACGGNAGSSGKCAECAQKRALAASPAPLPMDGSQPQQKEDDPEMSAQPAQSPAPTATPWVTGPPIARTGEAPATSPVGGMPAPTATPWTIGAAIAVANTTICDGAGGITYQANNIGNADQVTCLQNCVNVHEASHVTDARADGSDVCTGKTAGVTVRPPNETVRKATEIKASQAEIDCLNAQLATSAAPCTEIIRTRITQMIAYRDSFK